MRIESLREVKAKLSALINRLKDGPVVITKNGRPCAALVELRNEDDLDAFLLANNRRLAGMIDKSIKRGGRTSLDALEAALRSPK